MLYNSRVGVVFSICLSIVLTNTLLTSIHEGGEASPYLVVILSSDVRHHGGLSIWAAHAPPTACCIPGRHRNSHGRYARTTIGDV